MVQLLNKKGKEMEKKINSSSPKLDPENQRRPADTDDLKRLLLFELIHNYQALLFTFSTYSSEFH